MSLRTGTSLILLVQIINKVTAFYGILALFTSPLARPLVRTLFTRTDGPSLNKTLAGTGQLLALYSVVLSAGLLL